MKPYPDTHYEEVAEVALAGGTRNGVAVAKHWNVPITRAHVWIAQARERGFLPKYSETMCPRCDLPRQRHKTTKREECIRLLIADRDHWMACAARWNTRNSSILAPPLAKERFLP